MVHLGKIVLYLSVLLASGVYAATVFREPFTLTLAVDGERNYEEQFDSIPYVDKGAIHLFKGDSFGVNLGLKGGAVTGLSYVEAGKTADLTLRFTQETLKDGTQVMMLVLHNNTAVTLYIDAVMTIPSRREMLNTSILPIDAGMSGYEMWPHPIVQLVLQNIRAVQ